MVQVVGKRGACGEFGALGVVELRGVGAHDVWSFVADVEQQPTWNNGVKHSRVVERRGNCKSVHQVLSWNFLALRGDMHLKLDQMEDPAALTINTELTSGTMMRAFRSRVGVRETAPGVCELEMEMFMQPAIFVPFGIRHMVGGQVRRQLRGVLSNLQTRFEARAAARAARGGGGARAGGEEETRQWGAGLALPLWGWQPQWPAAAQQQQLRLQQRLQAQAPWWTAVDIVAAA
ncbi:hypothetical protein Rsub_04546 [Raphidocelis subcapitata]|uniref:Coenzyme Q-binding protein COQ10 START domain-containing protein n=1 Tax=Raphidocelis subcapitata TaxID=307507 RepID=A0A2V0P0J7_9CHLO|nr:hypothetical protein Rsub_04546 [Raphidocelis subcapitata]|eukprot:GBF92442.1 hypothetical protein Rsub_04546 [Raphidocelis subcapitata]